MNRLRAFMQINIFANTILEMEPKQLIALNRCF